MSRAGAEAAKLKREAEAQRQTFEEPAEEMVIAYVLRKGDAPHGGYQLLEVDVPLSRCHVRRSTSGWEHLWMQVAKIEQWIHDRVNRGGV